jgi:hypothetical protein
MGDRTDSATYQRLWKDYEFCLKAEKKARADEAQQKIIDQQYVHGKARDDARQAAYDKWKASPAFRDGRAGESSYPQKFGPDIHVYSAPVGTGWWENGWKPPIRTKAARKAEMERDRALIKEQLRARH